MKKCFIVLVFLTIVCAGQAIAQKNVMKTNPIGLAFGNFNLTYEGVLNSDKASVLVSANYFYNLFGVDVNTIGFGVAYRHYLTHQKVDVPTGLYVNPQIGASFGSAGDLNYNTISVGAEVGYQWAWDSGVAIDLGIGPNYILLGGEYEDIDFDNEGGVVPSITIALGYAW